MIVECPGCQSRYNVTGRPPGTRARCRCGTIFTLPAPSEQASRLACPNCGGSVAPTNHDCEFCGDELLVLACPRCFARIFHGAKHCSECGAASVVPATADTEGRATPRACPRCGVALEGRLVSDVLLDECNSCHGVFVDVSVLERILAERRQPRAEAILGLARPALAEVGAGGERPGGPMYVRCPDCEKMMNRRNFARGSGIIVDVCASHGTWFDANELPRVIEFVSKGGLEAAARKATEELREAERRARSAARIQQQSGTGLAMPARGDRVWLFGALIGGIGRKLTE